MTIFKNKVFLIVSVFVLFTAGFLFRQVTMEKTGEDPLRGLVHNVQEIFTQGAQLGDQVVRIETCKINEADQHCTIKNDTGRDWRVVNWWADIDVATATRTPAFLHVGTTSSETLLDFCTGTGQWCKFSSSTESAATAFGAGMPLATLANALPLSTSTIGSGNATTVTPVDILTRKDRLGDLGSLIVSDGTFLGALITTGLVENEGEPCGGAVNSGSADNNCGTATTTTTGGKPINVYFEITQNKN